ncbi:transposon Tf2-11 polyprotein [Trichonephila clavipes]|nr:transposon Tf2-11 polyprotein [Trichonephila clavipes]
MSGEIAEFVQTCKGCQLRKPEKIGDRAPITPIVRPELPFEIVNIDVIGPIQPPSGRGHKYVLSMMDQHTRWPEAVPLRSLTAKNACDSLLQIFSRIGIPSIIASDQGTNFKSALTQEFTKRIGSSPRFSCPGNPASNGLVERWNKVLKDMIHHVIREDPRSWDRQLPFLLFAYREVPNTTTGVSPFRLLYGREARGPLAILKLSWAGEIHLPTNISQSAADYLQEMKINMEKAAESASLTAAQKQKAYGDYFNKSNKIYARWTGPGEIIQHHPPHSYKVKLSDGTVRHVHVNKIRKYHPRALAVGVIFEGDHEFGEIHPTPNLSRSTSERVLHEINLNHLKETVRISHTESLKIKVDEQIEELVRLDLIEESDAEIAYPIVCVNKKDGTLRLCVDFRALNSESVSDDFPMEDAVELIHSIGRANIITTLDLLKGYWAIPMAEDSKNLTSFKTHRQQYRFKCAFGKAQIKYLGHIIGSGKHEPDPEKTAVINNLPVPKTKKELRSVLGLCNYYREYIPKYSELVYPLTELTKKEST